MTDGYDGVSVKIFCTTQVRDALLPTSSTASSWVTIPGVIRAESATGGITNDLKDFLLRSEQLPQERTIHQFIGLVNRFHERTGRPTGK